MTVAELINALQKMPKSKVVKVVLSHTYLMDESCEQELIFFDDDAIEADEVIDLGNCVLIRSK